MKKWTLQSFKNCWQKWEKWALILILILKSWLGQKARPTKKISDFQKYSILILKVWAWSFWIDFESELDTQNPLSKNHHKPHFQPQCLLIYTKDQRLNFCIRFTKNPLKPSPLYHVPPQLVLMITDYQFWPSKPTTLPPHHHQHRHLNS